jgi:predicted outer membrane protein
MQPNEPPQFSIDYLDQIASPPKKPGVRDKLFPILVIGGLIVALLVGLVAILGAGGGNQEDMMRLPAKLKTLQSVADSSQKNIKSSGLRSTNGNLSLFLTNTNRDMAEPLSANNVDAAKLSPKITASEDGSDLKAELEDARLNVVFDRTYAREMSYQLEALAALMQQIEANTNSRSLKEALTTAQKQLEPLQKQFADFTAASS